MELESRGVNEFNDRLATKVNTVLLIIHIGLLAMFAMLHAPIMVIVNVFSILTYIVLYKVLKISQVIFVIVVYIEILVHMLFATVCMGWDCGYQLYCFSLLPIIYHTEYLAKKNGGKTTFPNIISLIIMLCFIFSRIHTLTYKPVYDTLDDATMLVLFSTNIVMIFGFIMGYMGMYVKMTLNVEGRLLRSATYDELTGLPNRYKMHSEFLDIKDDEDVSIAIMDIDDFKNVNDTYGHGAGDKVLKEVASVLKSIQNERTIVSRWGGEEFLVVCKGAGQTKHLQEIMEEARKTVQELTIIYNSIDIKVTISAGVTGREAGELLETTVRRADEMLYQAKSSGKNKVI